MATAKKKPKDFHEEMELPAGASIEAEGGVLKLSISGKQMQAKYNNRVVTVAVKDGKAIFKCVGKATRPKVAAAMSARAHLRNMLAGAKQEYSKHLQVIYAHFPVSIEVKGKDVMIKNFLGEKLPRSAKIEGNVQVEAKGQDIYVKGNDKYSVGQTANNIVRATMIREKDRRVFQDGIYPAAEQS